MGHGIAQVCAAAGHRVAVYDPSPEVLASVPARIRSIFELTGQDRRALERISIHSDCGEAVSAADFVFEAAPEKLAIKQDVFARLAATTKPAAVLASNTSVIPIGDLSARVNRRDAGRIVGTHFWNPPHLVPLVEVVQAERTDLPVVENTIELLKSVGRVPVHVKRDIPGFIGNRLQHALKREAIALVADGVCDAETIDLVVKHGFGARLAVLGPMEQSDLVGLGLTLDIHRVLLPHLDRTPGPHPFLEQKVAAGELGMSTGRGFRTWTPEQCAEVRERLNRHLLALAGQRQYGSQGDRTA
jgi:3-hydroxybutyryl-CoA dehydrogenase